MADRSTRAAAALEDIVAVEHHAPGMVNVVSVSDAYVVDVRNERCECPDMQYHLAGEGRCKHVWAALFATDRLEIPVPGHTLLRALGKRDVPDCPDCRPGMPCFEHDQLAAEVGDAQVPERDQRQEGRA